MNKISRWQQESTICPELMPGHNEIENKREIKFGTNSRLLISIRFDLLWLFSRMIQNFVFYFIFYLAIFCIPFSHDYIPFCGSGVIQCLQKHNFSTINIQNNVILVFTDNKWPFLRVIFQNKLFKIKLFDIIWNE